MLRTALLAATLLSAPASAETMLMMFDQPGCSWCAAWTEEVGPVYARTDEGRIAPLLRQDISAPLPEGVVLESRPVYTPTFVLVHDGAEVARIEGYPGEDFFWGLLDMMIDKLPADARRATGT